jgi:hypothetical protein
MRKEEIKKEAITIMGRDGFVACPLFFLVSFLLPAFTQELAI